MSCRPSIALAGLGSLLLWSACQTQPYAAPPQEALVESLEVEVAEFVGRPEATATIRGWLSSSSARLVDIRQSRGEGRLILEVREQTPRPVALGLDPSDGGPAPFETRLPLELLGLQPGDYTVVANGVETEMTLPVPRAAPATGEDSPTEVFRPPVVTLVDEFIPIEDLAHDSPSASF